ncbi:hypothetical protein A2U01_0024790, partial [Trifolium medium]|nr:hypothetical protein [Trifolium medium]
MKERSRFDPRNYDREGLEPLDARTDLRTRTLLEQRDEAFSCDNGKNLSLAMLRNSN